MSFFRQRTGSNLAVFAAFLVLSVAMRIFTFFPTVISHDESTFLVIAREMLMGKTYFADLVDTKPIGIFVLLSLFIKYISTSIFMVRFFAALFVGATAYMIYRINLYDTREIKPALAGGVIFIFFVSTWEFFGIFINPELFYLFFTSLGFYIFIRYKTPSGFFVTGLLLGTGFILKYVVLFDLAAWLLFYFIGGMFVWESKKRGKVFLNCILAGLGFLIPFGIVVLVYHFTGHLKELFYYTFTVTSRFPTERTLVGILVFIGDFHLRFLPVIFFFYYVMIKDKETNGHQVTKPLIITWCLMILVAVLLPGRPFGHYFMQMMLPVSIMAGRVFRSSLAIPAWLGSIIRRPAGPVILSVCIAATIILQKIEIYDKPDYPKQIAAYLKPMLKEEDRIYTGNYHHVLYYILEKECPTRYVHRTLLCEPDHREVLGIDLAKEMQMLMAQDFRFIIMEGEYCYEPMNEHIKNNYHLIRTFDGDIYVYEKNVN